MASVTQTIPQFSLGMSEQPDNLKFPGQVTDIVNAIPDVTDGLFKRPGAKRVGTSKLPNVYTNQSHATNKNGAWFHYFRDELEGSYIGQIDINGVVRIWSCETGAEQTIVYGSAQENAGGGFVQYDTGTIEKAYLATTNPENLQFLTINDTTFVTNRDINNPNTIITNDSFSSIWEMTSATQVTITKAGLTNYNLAVGDRIYLDFYASITGKPTSGPVTIVSLTGSQFVANVSGGTNGANSGNTLAVKVTKLTDPNPDGHYAMLELLRTENGRQYGLDIFNTAATTTLTRATRIKIQDDNLYEGDGSGSCPGIGTQVFSVDGADNQAGTSTTKTNLIFRINTLGQQGVSPNYSAQSEGPDGDNYQCSYQREVVLLHGGEGWAVGDTATVTLDSAKGGGGTKAQSNSGTNANYTIRVEEIETTVVNATVAVQDDGLIRPEPTPFDAQTAVTADTILGGLKQEIDAITDVSCKVIGNGLYISSNNPFTVNVVEKDLMRVMQTSVNDVQSLPNQCKHGYIVKVSNALRAEEDDYYLRFEGQNDKDGNGAWTECAKPNINKALNNMPLVIQRTATNTFTVKQFNYGERDVGDEFTNPMPSFLGKRINKVLFFRNRLAFLAGENVITSRPGTLGKPNFFIETALTVSVADPVDISAASMFPSDLFDGIEINAGLLVFSTNQQFLLASDDTVFNPDTAKLRSIATFNYNEKIAPISLGTTVAYIDNSGKFSRFNEMANTAREGEPNIIEVSKVVPTLLPNDIDLLTNSRENSIVLMGKTGTSTVFGYKYFQTADKRVQASWFKWQLNSPLLYHFIINDEYFYIDNNYFLQSIRLVQSDTDPSIVQDNVNFLLHVDNHTTVSGGSYSTSTNTTTFSGVGWLTDVTSPNYDLVVVDSSTDSARTGRYGKPTVSGTSFTLPGDWSREITSINISNGGVGYTSAPTVTINGGGGTGALATATLTDGVVTAINILNNGHNFTSAPTIVFSGGGSPSTVAAATATINSGSYIIGYLYPYQVKLPTLYPTKVDGARATADVNASLVLHRVKFHFGKVGLYETTLERVGKLPYTELYESTNLDEYDVGDAPYLEEFIKTVPVYERNTNVDITLKSSHPSPATLRSLSWEGDYSPKYYRRV